MKTIAIFNIPTGSCIVSGPDFCDQQIVVNGKTWKFDFDNYCGPLWLRKDGEPRQNQNPNKKVWDEFQKWHDKKKTL